MTMSEVALYDLVGYFPFLSKLPATMYNIMRHGNMPRFDEEEPSRWAILRRPFLLRPRSIKSTTGRDRELGVKI